MFANTYSILRNFSSVIIWYSALYNFNNSQNYLLKKKTQVLCWLIIGMFGPQSVGLTAFGPVIRQHIVIKTHGSAIFSVDRGLETKTGESGSQDPIIPCKFTVCLQFLYKALASEDLLTSWQYHMLVSKLSREGPCEGHLRPKQQNLNDPQRGFFCHFLLSCPSALGVGVRGLVYHLLGYRWLILHFNGGIRSSVLLTFML